MDKARNRERPTEVVAALIWRDGRFLACQRPDNKDRPLLWEFAGGKVEPGETRGQALVRELREELGVTVKPERIYREVIHEYPDITIHLTLFEASVISGEPRAIEHKALRWVTPAEAESYQFCPADIEIIRALANGG